MTLFINVYSDVICPWCYLGKKRLEEALKVSGKKAEVHFLPFELNPSTPKEGVDHQKYLAEKFGGSHVLDQAHARLTALGQEVGIEYQFDHIEKIPNTLNAHRILWLAQMEGKGNKAHNAMFKSYFTDGKDLGDSKILTEIAISVGLEPTHVEKLLGSNEFEVEVKASEERAFALGVQGVPFFIFNDQFIVSGAQDLKTFLKAIEKAVQ